MEAKGTVLHSGENPTSQEGSGLDNKEPALERSGRQALVPTRMLLPEGMISLTRIKEPDLGLFPALWRGCRSSVGSSSVSSVAS